MDKNQAKQITIDKTGWTEEEFNTNQQFAENNCICGNCPTYVEGTTGVFCWPAYGKTEEITNEINCICPECTVFTEMSLRFAYHCTRGSDVEQAADVVKEAAA